MEQFLTSAKMSVDYENGTIFDQDKNECLLRGWHVFVPKLKQHTKFSRIQKDAV